MQRPGFKDLIKKALFNFRSFKETVRQRKERQVKLFEGNILAKTLYPESSFLLYTHLNPTEGLWGEGTLIDKLGNEHIINLDNVPFIIQKKGVSLADKLTPLIREANHEEVLKAIHGLFAVCNKLYDLGLVDRDYGVYKNFGFYEEMPFHLDMGKLEKHSAPLTEAERKKEFYHIKQRLFDFISEISPIFSKTIQKSFD